MADCLPRFAGTNFPEQSQGRTYTDVIAEELVRKAMTEKYAPRLDS